MNETQTAFEPVKVYREGKFDRKYWYSLQAKIYLREKAGELAQQIDSIFEQHSLVR